MTVPALTSKLRGVLEFIHEHHRTKGYPPTRAEIATRFGWRSSNAADESVRALRVRGYLTAEPHRSRGLRLTSEALVLLTGSAMAGTPGILALPVVDPDLVREHAARLAA